jgi:hypothetical protein
MLHSLPIITSPAIVALGAIKQFFPHLGVFSSTGKIKAISKNIDCRFTISLITIVAFLISLSNSMHRLLCHLLYWNNSIQLKVAIHLE